MHITGFLPGRGSVRAKSCSTVSCRQFSFFFCSLFSSLFPLLAMNLTKRVVQRVGGRSPQQPGLAKWLKAPYWWDCGINIERRRPGGILIRLKYRSERDWRCARFRHASTRGTEAFSIINRWSWIVPFSRVDSMTGFRFRGAVSSSTLDDRIRLVTEPRARIISCAAGSRHGEAYQLYTVRWLYSSRDWFEYCYCQVILSSEILKKLDLLSLKPIPSFQFLRCRHIFVRGCSICIYYSNNI